METNICQRCKKDFTIEPDDLVFYQKIQVPPPTWCSECRNQRRLSWRNDTSLYNSTCALCHKNIVTLYSPESKVIPYCNKCWWSDSWDPSLYGQEYDFSKPFFEQFKELILKVPHLALVNDNGTGSVNSEYTQDFSFAKNCYMVFVAWHIENVMYSYYLIAGKDMMDCLNVMSNSGWLYECIQPEECFNVKYSHFATSCMDSQFIFDCKNCTNCFMCSGLRNKKYCFKNEQYSKEVYEQILESYKLDSYSGVQKAEEEFQEFIIQTPRRYALVIQSYNCTGDLLNNGKNSFFCFNVQNPTDCKWIDNADTITDSYDVATSGQSNLIYESITCDNSSRNIFGCYSWKSQDLEYTHHCHSSKDLFGCVGLKNKQYCIFNKQYSKEAYFELKDKIKKQMNELPYTDKKGRVYRYGEFYPSELSHFGYNETIAQERFPLAEEVGLNEGFKWQYATQQTKGKETLGVENIPDSIHDINEEILKEILKCTTCERNYKIVPDELAFYRKMNIPIPRKCFYCRHKSRIEKRNPFKLWKRTCMNTSSPEYNGSRCQNNFETTYAPDRPEIVYCEKCYQREMI